MIVSTLEGVHEVDLVEYNTIGRHSKNRINIKDLSVSKEHALIFMRKDQSWMIRDLGSTNGTFVNQRQIQREEEIYDGDEVRLGSIRCVFKAELAYVAKMIEVREEGLETLIFKKEVSVAQDRFFPANEITDVELLRADYEKLRVAHELQRDIGLDADIETVLDIILERIFEFLNCDRGVILLVNKSGQLEAKAYKTRTEEEKLIVSSTLIQHVKEEKVGLIFSDILTDTRFRDAESIIGQRICSTIAVPILYQEELLGIILIDSSETTDAFSEKELNLISNIANQTAQLIKNSLLHNELKLCFDSSIQTLSAMVDERHPLTAGHSQRVTAYSLLVAEEMGLRSEEIEALKFSALLHDIGKIGIKDDILLKNGAFTPEEKAAMNTHPTKTKTILENFRFPSLLKDVPQIASCHHEKINGKGYPRGLTGDQMPVISKIVVVADVFDALTSVRDYPKYLSEQVLNNNPMPLPYVISILKSESGSHFDPDVVSAFLRCLPHILLQYRGSHFSSEYVDDTIRTLAPDLLF
ncbi:MAG: FHA domain-containing protein [Thermodesulfobacteriota bacterium]|nr:FHA domain-containing protein [Thermodesulfobacteriota bacterium]